MINISPTTKFSNQPEFGADILMHVAKACVSILQPPMLSLYGAQLRASADANGRAKVTTNAATHKAVMSVAAGVSLFNLGAAHGVASKS